MTPPSRNGALPPASLSLPLCPRTPATVRRCFSMALDLDIACPADEREIAAFARIATQSLRIPSEEHASNILTRIGPPNLRVVRLGSEVVAGLGIIPMGHWFAGRSVSCAGVSVVAVAPEHRSRGIATELMRTLLEETRREGTALSSLFPATFPLYRATGYETAGNRFVYRIALSALGSGARGPEVRAATSQADFEAIRAIYDARVRSNNGPTDRSRSPYFWQRIFEPLADDVRGYLVRGEHGFEGYAVLSHRLSPEQLASRDLPIRDLAFATPSAAARLFRLLGDHQSIYRSATLVAGPADPLLLLAREERPEVVETKRWMLRVLDVRAALEQRGWRGSARGELHLDVRDQLLRENSRRWVLEVAGGRAQVREGGDGALAIDVRGLASLYSGYLPAEELRAAGMCEGSKEALAEASALFAGPAPWTPDFF
jgi:predicted acetyltransferase